jgi:serine/threonine-protein kinase RsbW
MDVIYGSAVVELELESAPESVALVRAALKGLGLELGLDPELLDDLQMVASEACNNVVLHAYPDGSGPVSIRIAASQDGVELRVRDWGEGVDPSLCERGGGAVSSGLGLAVIESLADDAELAPADGGGTEIRMVFARPVHGIGSSEQGSGVSATGRAALDGPVVASVSPVSLLPAVLGRVARALAAQARFSVERFSDIHLVVDALSGYVERSATDGHVSFSLGTETRLLNLQIGPLRRRAIDVASRRGGFDPLLRRLVDHIDVAPLPDGEAICLTLTERGLAHAV